MSPCGITVTAYWTLMSWCLPWLVPVKVQPTCFPVPWFQCNRVLYTQVTVLASVTRIIVLVFLIHIGSLCSVSLQTYKLWKYVFQTEETCHTRRFLPSLWTKGRPPGTLFRIVKMTPSSFPQSNVFWTSTYRMQKQETSRWPTQMTLAINPLQHLSCYQTIYSMPVKQ